MCPAFHFAIIEHMYESMGEFSPPTRVWFSHAFGKPTEAQSRAWPAIRSGRNTLVIAPTGSGKTLAAFLAAIDRLMAERTQSARSPQEEVGAQSVDSPAPKAGSRCTSRNGRRHGVRILYVSPLKALAADVAKNLMRPLEGIAVQCEAMGLPAPKVTVATRSGDTTPAERRRIAAHPPDILVTTPESLYLMLTSKAREALSGVETVIVDEVHALAGSKRGAHLALSLERLDELVARKRSARVKGVPEVSSESGSGETSHSESAKQRDNRSGGEAPNSRVQRIGLSATVRPADEVARFLVGTQPIEIIDAGTSPAMDLRIVEPLADMRDLASANVKHRAGGVDGDRPDAKPISGVTPAMRRLAARRGLAKPDGDGIGYQAVVGMRGGMTRMPARSHADGDRSEWSPTNDRQFGSISVPAIIGAPGDGMGGMGPAADGAGSLGGGASASESSGGSIWPVVERSVLDEILAHRTTLVFVNSRGLAEKLTARLNDLYVERRGQDKGSPEGREGFAEHYDAVVGGTTQLVGSHGTDDAIAMAHHGSVSKDRRKRIEEGLKHGRLRCVVATSSLELGIDMGSVDLVIQIAPPLSVSSGLQRVGRADHRVGGVSHALFYPLTREQIIGAAASIEAMRDGDIEPLSIPRNPLDILAQQTVAAAAMDDLDPNEWYAVVRHAAPFVNLERSDFDAVMGMMTGAYDAEDFSAFRPPLVMNEETGVISARPGAQRLAVTSGGTIPDRGLYTVVLPEADAGKGPKRVGELDEEMVYESRVGDVITLGTSTWQIKEITRDRVVVTPAPGRTARLPFWHGEGAGRDAGFGRIKGRFLREVAAGLAADSVSLSERSESKNLLPEPVRTHHFDEPTEARLLADGLDTNAIGNLASLLAEQKAFTGVVPSDRDLLIECCPDEEGDWRVILHSLYGRRVHEPWAMAVSNRLKQQYGFDGQTYAADDGIIVRLPEGVAGGVLSGKEGRGNPVTTRFGDADSYLPVLADSVSGKIASNDAAMRQHTAAWLRDLFLFDPDDLTRAIETQVGESVLFAARFRECAARSLFLPRERPGKRVPLWQQRLRAAQLLNAARTRRNFPLLLETARECLRDVYDLPALRELMTALKDGSITLSAAETQQLSPLAENLLFGYVGQVMYQYDVPQAERSAQLLSVDPEVLERLLGDADLSTVLDPEAIVEVTEELSGRTFWNELAPDDVTGRVTRYAKTHGPFTAVEAVQSLGLPAADIVHELDRLLAQGDLIQARFTNLSLSMVEASSDPILSAQPTGGGDLPGKAGGITPDQTSSTSAPLQYLHKEVFRRIRARSLKRAREAIKPVEPATFQRFLFDRQGIGPAGEPRYEGLDGLMRIIEQLEGIALPTPVWETAVFPTRVRDYRPAMLDELIATGDVVWVGSGDAKPGAAGSVSFHPADSELLFSNLAQDDVNISDGGGDRAVCDVIGRSRGSTANHGNGEASRRAAAGLGALPDAILDVLAGGGAWRADQLAAMARRRWNELAPEVNPDTGEIVAKPWSDQQFRDALWSLVWKGTVTNSSFAPVRAMADGTARSTRTVRAPLRASRRRVRIAAPATASDMSGLWMAVGAMNGNVETGSRETMLHATGMTPDAVARLDGAYRDSCGPAQDESNMPADGTQHDQASDARERRVLALVEVLLDRYGVIASPLVAEEVPGGFSALYPVLKRMEERGTLVRGMFVQGFGAAQFATKETVDVLRGFANERGESADGCGRETVLAISALDPVSLAGGTIPWPTTPEVATKPARRAGGIVVYADGTPVVYASAKSRHLTVLCGGDPSTSVLRTSAQDDNKEMSAGVSARDDGREMPTGGFAWNGGEPNPVILSEGSGATEVEGPHFPTIIDASIAALVEALLCTQSGSITLSDVNGQTLTLRNPWFAALRRAGFAPSPQGMTFYR